MHGFVWTFLGTGGQAGLQLLVLVILARLLVPAEFGLVTAALVVVGFSTILSQLGIGPALVQRHDLQRSHVSTGFTISLLLGGLFCGLGWYLAPALADFFSLDNFTPVLRVLSLIFPVLGMGVVAESLLQRNLRFRRLAVVELVAMFLGYGVLGITLAFLGFGVWALVGAHLAQATLKTSLLLVVQPHPIYPFLDRKACAELMNFGCGFTMAQIGNYVAGQGDNLVIGRFLGAAALGVYGRAYQLMAGPAVILGQVLDRVLFPAMSRMQTRPDHLAETYRRSIALVALMILPTSAILVVLAPELILVLLGPEWDDVVMPFQILTVGMIFRASYKISDALVGATGAVYRRAWRQAAYAGLVLAGAWMGQLWGVPGVALAVLATLAINFSLMAHLSLNVASLTWRGFVAAHVPGLALSVLLGLGAWSFAALLREGGVAAILVLVLSGTAVLLLFFLVPFWPKVFLGRDGRWLLRTLAVSRRRSLRQYHACQSNEDLMADHGANGIPKVTPLASPFSGPTALAAPTPVPRSRGMVVEFIGPTGVGKSTLMAAVKETLTSQGFTVWEAHDLILRRFRLNFIHHSKVQSFLVHLLVLPFFLGFLFTKKGLRLFGLAVRLIARDGGNYRICLIRNVIKRIGLHLALQKRNPELCKVDFILCDEGILHNAHNLFVHPQTKPKRTEIIRFADLVPLPDLVIWVTAPPGQSVRCILKRGHARVSPTPAGAHAFVVNAHFSFNTLCSAKKLQGRLYRINNTVNGKADTAQTIRERATDIAEFVIQHGSVPKPLSQAPEQSLNVGQLPRPVNG